MRDLDIKLLPVDGDAQAALVELAGTLDGNSTPAFDASIKQLTSQGIRRVILQMSGLRYVNSTGLGTLVRHADALRSSDGGMALIQVPGKVDIIIEMSGLNALLVTCADLPSALHALTSTGSRGHGSRGHGSRGHGEEPSPLTQTSRWRSSAARLAAEDPELAQRRCRTAIERALTNLYQQRVGDSAGQDMTQILQVLQQQNLLPTKVFALAYTVWELSEIRAPALGDTEDDARREAYIAVAAMTVLQKWFKRNYPEVWG